MISVAQIRKSDRLLLRPHLLLGKQEDSDLRMNTQDVRNPDVL